MLSSGDLLSQRYRLDERIATGGMGDVWRGTDVVLGRNVAIKVLLPTLVTDPDFNARFEGEARTLASLRHPGVVDVYDYGESELVTGETAVYMVMAYVHGEPLSHRIADAGRLGVPETLSLVTQAARALHAAHGKGIVHRDVKPGNLLVQPDGQVILVDFGVARSAAVTSVTAANAVPGTALYMAPEQASGKAVSPATDIYALGVVAYHCLAGETPFTGKTPIEVAIAHLHSEPPPLPDDVPASVQALVARALAKDPADRFPSAQAFAVAASNGRSAAALRSAVAGGAASSPTAGRTGGTGSFAIIRPAGPVDADLPGPITGNGFAPVASRALAGGAGRDLDDGRAFDDGVAAVPGGGIVDAPAGRDGPSTLTGASVVPEEEADRPRGWKERRMLLGATAAVVVGLAAVIAVLATRAEDTKAPDGSNQPPAATSAAAPATGAVGPVEPSVTVSVVQTTRSAPTTAARTPSPTPARTPSATAGTPTGGPTTGGPAPTTAEPTTPGATTGAPPADGTGG